MKRGRKLEALDSFTAAKFLKDNGVDGHVVMISDIDATPGFYLVNLDPDPSSGGTHWTAMVLDKNKMLYFDSFGAPPPTAIVEVARRKRVPIHWNNFIVQNVDSHACGYYGIMFLVAMAKNNNPANFNSFVNFFYDNTAHNEKLVEDIFISK